MYRIIIITAFMLNSFIMAGQEKDSLLVMFWNLENFFDYIDGGGGEADKEFSSSGNRRWTKNRFYTKCDAVAKTVFAIGDICGRMPDLIGLAEVENRGVLSRMLASTALRKYDYRIIHHESGDRRGIDVAVLYRHSSMRHISNSVRTPEYDGVKLATRDILQVRMCLPSGCIYDFIVNHHPSKFGGAAESDKKRLAAVTTLRNMCDSLDNEKIVAMGDFNDDPDSEAFEVVGDVLVNKASSLHERGEGTIRYEGKWDLIDMFLVSPKIDSICKMEIMKIPFLMTSDSKHPGEKPLRTYTGPRYSGGVSDHCPIILRFF